MAELLIYGATGYTGRMLARRAAAHGLDFAVGGRNPSKVAALAAEVGVEGVVLDVDDSAALDAAVEKASCVINAAGPFAATGRQLFAACINQKAHYVDITGEVDVFTLAETLDEDARRAGVMLMPGAGWDVVPSDCIALHVVRRVPDAELLRIGLAHINGVPSRGTLRTGLSMAGRNVMRRDGKLVESSEPLPPVEMDFGFSRFQCTQMPMGDVVTAFKSTGVRNIEIYGARAGGGCRSRPADSNPFLKARAMNRMRCGARSPWPKRWRQMVRWRVPSSKRGPAMNSRPPPRSMSPSAFLQGDSHPVFNRLPRLTG